MLDTVAMLATIDSNVFINRNQFQHSLLFRGKDWHRWNKILPAKYKHLYFPHVEYWNHTGLFIRCSVPKLLYGNNLVEVQSSDVEIVYAILKERLELMGIDIPQAYLSEAVLKELHIGKNAFCYGVPLALTWPQMAMVRVLEIGKDVYHGTYKKGEKLSFSGRKIDLVLYEKYPELSAHPQQGLPADFFQRPDVKDIFRSELRFKTSKAIKDEFGFELKFKDAWNEELMKNKLLKFWGALYKQVQKIPRKFCSPEYEFFQLGQDNPSLRLQTRLMVGYLHCLVSSLGTVETKRFLERYYPKQQVNCILAYLNKVKFPSMPKEYNFIKVIDNQLRQFKWLTPEDIYKKQPLLVDKNTPLSYQELFTVEEVAKFLKVNPKTVRKWCCSGRLSVYRLGKEYRLSRTQIMEYLHATQRGI